MSEAPIDLASLRAALARLSCAFPSDPSVPDELEGWRIAPLPGGRNNRLFKLSNASLSVVAKFTMRDARDRAGREYNALLSLAAAGLAIAPLPFLLDRDAYCQPVVVQEWVDGEPLQHPPNDDVGWERLAELLTLTHRLRPGDEAGSLLPAVLTAHTAAGALQIVRDELGKMPEGERLPEVAAAAARLERQSLSRWPVPPPTLVRCDPNVRNVIRRPGVWAYVDWEYSGWGDPAYDVAELMLHPSYIAVPEARWAWFCNRVLDGDATARARVSVYRKTINVWWLARLSRLRYETPRGLDRRLAQLQPGWDEELARNYEHYLHLANSR